MHTKERISLDFQSQRYNEILKYAMLKAYCFYAVFGTKYKKITLTRFHLRVCYTKIVHFIDYIRFRCQYLSTYCSAYCPFVLLSSLIIHDCFFQILVLVFVTNNEMFFAVTQKS